MAASLVSVSADQIPVVASSDDNYALPLGVMFISLLENTQCPERFSLFVIDGGISQSKREQLKSDIESRGAKLSFLDVNSELYADFPTCAHISAPAYYRISIPELFDDSVTRVIYLDCDLIIKGDLQELWALPLNNHPIAAVENISSQTYKASGLDQADYFNSGVMILDLTMWREQHLADKVRRFKMEHPELICTNDQCALNGVFRGKWQRLPLYWNQQSGLYRDSKQTRRFKSADQWEQAIWEPGIIHYVGWSKPWLMPCFHPLEGEFRRYDTMASQSSMAIAERVAKLSLFKGFREKISLAKKRHRQSKWQAEYLRRGVSLFK